MANDQPTIRSMRWLTTLRRRSEGDHRPTFWQDAVSRGKDETHDAVPLRTGRAHRCEGVLAARDWQQRNPSTRACDRYQDFKAASRKARPTFRDNAPL